VTRRYDVILLLILATALGLRLHRAVTEAYVHDEENNAIPLATSISFSPGHVNLPVRGENHGALPAYIVAASSTLFGTSHLGYRGLHLALGLAPIVLVYLLTLEWYGPPAARWASAVVAFNEYYLDVSSRATAHVPHLLLVMCAVFAFARFLRENRPAYLYWAGLALGLAFYCKEHSALLLPAFFVTLLTHRNRRWLLTPHPYGACAVWLLLISPHLYSNLTTTPGTLVHYGDQPANQATYSSHFKRLGGVGLSPYPFMFYARETTMSVYQRIRRKPLKDETEEYRSMNPVLGLGLLAAALVSLFKKSSGDDGVRPALLWLFWGIFLFFVAIKKGDPPGRLDPASWIWVESTMFPASVLAGARLAELTRWRRAAAWTVAATALGYAAWAAGLAPG
jgi:4-amino-4-deoxy-L-arabinose transferase-like glycosyltransferase